MEASPKFKICRVSQLGPGDLFIYPRDEMSYVALSVVDHAKDGDRAILTLGPTFFRNAIGPTLTSPIDMTVISFGADFAVRLSAAPNGWATNPPDTRRPCIVANDGGNIFFRGNWAPYSEREFRPCFVDVKTGDSIVNPGNLSYIDPPGYKFYALDWALLTTEPEPRVILASRSADPGRTP